MELNAARRIDEIGGTGTTSIQLNARCIGNHCGFLQTRRILSPSYQYNPFYQYGRCTRFLQPITILSHSYQYNPSYQHISNSTLTESGENQRSDVRVDGRSSKSRVCKHWADGNCMHGEHCWNLHSWSDGIEVKFEEGNPKPMRFIWWTAPPKNFVKINCDGAFSYHGNKAAVGGVMRDSEGGFIRGFSSALASCGTVIESELLAIVIGMEIAISVGFKNLIVESDSLAAIQVINKGGYENSQSDHHRIWTTLALSIRQMGNKTDHVCWNHVFRETNSVADGLAKHGLSLSPDLGVELFDFPPPFTMLTMCADQAGITYIR